MRWMRSRPRVCEPTARIHFQSVIEEEVDRRRRALDLAARLPGGRLLHPGADQRPDGAFAGRRDLVSVEGARFSRACVRGRLWLERDHGGVSFDPRVAETRGRLERARQDRPAFQDGGRIRLNFNPGIIKGGDWASSVPAWCEVDCRIAVLPGWSIADCQNEILACVSAAARDHRFLSNNPPRWNGRAFFRKVMS